MMFAGAIRIAITTAKRGAAKPTAAACVAALVAIGTVALCGVGAALAEEAAIDAPPRPPSARPAPACDAAAEAARTARGVRVASTSATAVAHGAPIEVTWQLPPAGAGKARSFLVGAMASTVRFEGRYALDDSGLLAGGPGFVALTERARAPYGLAFGAGRTRVVIPIDGDVDRSGRLAVKPYAAGALEIEWAVASVLPDCPRQGSHAIALKPVATLGPFAVAAGAPEVVVQDFVEPDPRQQLAAVDGSQRLVEVELSSDGRYRLDIFERRYRVFERASGAKLVERSGVEPRFSPDGRFVVASIGDAQRRYPTDFEVVDLVARRVVARAEGPIVGWSNGDALLLDGARAYQSLALVNTLVDPVRSAEGAVANRLVFFPGCATCDAWTGSNIRFDWDRLAVLRGDAGAPPAMSVAMLAEGRLVETTSFGDGEEAALDAKLAKLFGRSRVALATGWSGDVAFRFTHVGRGYSGYVDEEDALTPEEKGRASIAQHVAGRRLALAGGRVLSAVDLRPAGALRSDNPQQGAADAAASARLDHGYVADELAKLGLTLRAAAPIAEEPIPRPSDWQEPVTRPWPSALAAEIGALGQTAKAPFEAVGEETRIIIGAWRIATPAARHLLVQHGDAAQTINGAHEIRFDLVALTGPANGAVERLGGIGGLFSQYMGRSHALARVFALSAGRIVVAEPSTGAAVLVDTARAEPAAAFTLVEPGLLCGVYEDAARGLVVQSNCDGQLFVFAPARQAGPIVSGRVFDGELLLYVPEGFYAATFEGAHFVHIAFPGLAGVHSFEQFAASLERPDVIRAAIEGKPAAAAAVALAPPPSITANLGVSAGTGGAPTGGESVGLVVTAAAANGLASVDLCEDGGFVARFAASGASARLEVPVRRRPHVRNVTLVARDRLGFRSRTSTVPLPAAAAARTNRLHVIAVGIDSYEKLNPLAGARYDAETFAAALQRPSPYYGAVDATVRVDRAATPAVVAADLRRAVAAATADDTIAVFFAGHGGTAADGRYFLTTAATDPDRIAETAIDWQAIASLLGTAKARVLVVIDACHAGQTGLVTPTNDGAVSSLAAVAAAPMVVLAASKGRQLSEEIAGGKGGVFTQTLVRKLTEERAAADTDGDGVLAVGEIYRSVKAAVEAGTGGRQTPWLVRRNLAGDAPLL